MTEAYLDCTEENRDERLYYLLTQHPGRTLIFTNAITMARRLAAVLKLLQLPVTAMHSSMQQRQRLKALERFRKSDSAIMIATDVAARGLDIPVRTLSLPVSAVCLQLQVSESQHSIHKMDRKLQMLTSADAKSDRSPKRLPNEIHMI